MGLTPHAARHPTAYPIPLLTAQHCPALESPPHRLPTSTPLPAALGSMTHFTLLETGASRRVGVFGRAAEDGVGSSGTPQPLLCKARGAARREGLTHTPPLPGCQGGGLGGTSGLDKRSRKERGAGRQLLGRGRRPGCRARDALARRTKPPLCEPRPSPPRWETAQGGFLGQAGSRGRVPPPPTAPGGWGPVRLARGLHSGARSSQGPVPSGWRLGRAGMQCRPQPREDAAAPPPLGPPWGEQGTCPSLCSQDWCPQKSEEPFHSTVRSSSPPSTQGKDDTAGCGCQYLRSPELLPCLSLPIQATKTTWQGHSRPHTGCWHCQGGRAPKAGPGW